MSELNIPSWLTANYFQKILSKNYKNTSIKVEHVEIEPCGANDGFLSTLWRVHVNYIMNSSEERESLVVKMSTSNEIAIEKVGANGYDVQKKEMLFFEVIAPHIKKVLKGIENDNSSLLPDVFTVDRIRKVIVFEDLRKSNFEMVDRARGLEDAHIRLSLKKLAQFHAASLLIQQKHPRAFEFFDMGMFNRKINVFDGAFLSIYEQVVNEVDTWPGFENYAKKLRNLKVCLIENATRCFDNNPEEFCVLNHGDVWTNNLMFTYNEEGVVNDAILVRKFCIRS